MQLMTSDGWRHFVGDLEYKYKSDTIVNQISYQSGHHIWELVGKIDILWMEGNGSISPPYGDTHLCVSHHNGLKLK